MKFLVTLLSCCLVAISFASSVYAQGKGQRGGVGVTLDSLVKLSKNADSLVIYDSLARIAAKAPVQLATFREIDITNDGKPETMRLFGRVIPEVDEIEFGFTIRARGRLLFTDTWKAKGYFDEYDKLNDSTKLRRLRRIVLVFFSNENFAIMDSAKLNNLLAQTTPAEVAIGSKEARELASGDRVMYSVFASRDNFYGLVWLPSKKRFVKAWQN